MIRFPLLETFWYSTLLWSVAVVAGAFTEMLFLDIETSISFLGNSSWP